MNRPKFQIGDRVIIKKRPEEVLKDRELYKYGYVQGVVTIGDANIFEIKVDNGPVLHLAESELR